MSACVHFLNDVILLVLHACKKDRFPFHPARVVYFFPAVDIPLAPLALRADHATRIEHCSRSRSSARYVKKRYTTACCRKLLKIKTKRHIVFKLSANAKRYVNRLNCRCVTRCWSGYAPPIAHRYRNMAPAPTTSTTRY